MDDPEVAAAIAAGELDGLAAALDKYAASLYEYCYSMAPEVAADAVQDTFIIAWSKLGGLRDPGKLHPWLQAVAGNECFRRTLAGSVTDPHADVAREATPPPETTLPPGLPGHILSACADSTPGGRAYRTSVAHRAGPFGYDGFPKPNALRGTRQRRVPRHRQAGAAVAAAAVLAAAAIMIVAISPASSSHQNQVSAAGPGSRQVGGSTVSGTDLPTTRARPILSSSVATPPGMALPSAAAAAGKPAGAPAGPPPVVPTATVVQETLPSPPPSPSRSPSPSPSPSPSRSPTPSRSPSSSPSPSRTSAPTPTPTHSDDVIVALVAGQRP
jgi:Sigma-70 region 2